MNEPSSTQKAAIESPSRRVLIIAAPGSGKTFCLVERGQWFLKEQIITEPERILFLTFTVKAAEEVAERFDGNVWSHTFHAFCFRLLQEFGERISLVSNLLRPPFTVMDETDQVVLMQECLDDLRWKMSAKKLVKWYNLGEPKGREPRLASGMTDTDLKTALFEFEQRKADSNAIDFRGLVTMLIRVLTLDPSVLLWVRQRWDAILVDELQDTAPLTMVLCRLLVRDDTYFTVVGDQDQCIYGFAEARPELMLGDEVVIHGLPKEVKERNVVSLDGWGSLRDKIPWEKHGLGENYRSDTEIVANATKLIQHNKNRYDIPIVPVSGLPGVVRGYEYEYDEEAEAFLSLIEHAKSFDGSLAILTRTNATAMHFARLLREDGRFAFHLVGEETDMWESQHAKRLLYVLRAASNRFDRWTALRVLWILQGDVDGALVAHMREKSATDGRALLDIAAQEIPELRDKLAGLRSVQTMRDEPGKIVAAIQMAKTILPWTPIHRRIEEYAEAWMRGGQSLASFLFFASYAKESFRERKEIEPGTIWISTVHRFKGQERDSIVVIAEHGEFPPKRKNTDEEERRVFYVAITRPKHRLYLVYANERMRYGKVRQSGPSQYLSEIWGAEIPALV